MNFFSTHVSCNFVLFKSILFLNGFGTQFVASIVSSQSGEPNQVYIEPIKYRGAILSGVENLFANKEVLVKKDMRHLFYKEDGSLRDGVNFNEVVVCHGEMKAIDLSTGWEYSYVACPDNAGSRWSSYSQLIRDSLSEKAYCCGRKSFPNCCSKDEFYQERPDLHPMSRPSDVNFKIKREQHGPEKMHTSIIIIIVWCSIAGVLIIAAIASLICCLCSCCCFAMGNSNRNRTGRYATNAATTNPSVYQGGGYSATAAATAHPAKGYGYSSDNTYSPASYSYASGYPANFK